MKILEFTNELNDFNDFKSTLQNLEKSAKERDAENQGRHQKVEQKLVNLEEASTMLIDKFTKAGTHCLIISIAFIRTLFDSHSRANHELWLLLLTMFF